MKRPRFTKYWQYIAAFLAVESLIAAILFFDIIRERDMIHRQNIEHMSIAYEAVAVKYQKLAEAAFYSAVDNNKTSSILLGAAQNQEQIDKYRKELYENMAPVYEKLRELGVKQFQFHLPNNTSFLRLHEPNRYGDSLGSFRHMVALVNRDKTPLYGFEEGRAASGLRYVFPIIKDGVHLGSVEFGIDFEAIISSLKMLSGAEYILAVKKDALEKPKMFNKELGNFTDFKLSNDYLLEGSGKKRFEQIESALLDEHQESFALIASKNPFSIDANIDGEDYAVSFYPIRDIRHIQSAYLIEFRKDAAYASAMSGLMRAFGVYTIFTVAFLCGIFLVNKKRESIWLLNESLEQKSGELQTILDASGGGLAILSSDGDFLYANNSFCTALGYEKNELLKLDIYKIGKNQKTDETEDAIDEALISGASFNFKKECVSKNGFSVIFSVQLTKMPDGKTLVMSATDITKDVEYAKSLELRAITDPLTKIFNRRHIENCVQDAVYSALKDNSTLSLVVMDIDHFKSINDKYGHTVGDGILKEFSSLITQNISDDDIFGRWGGEEFVLLCKNSTMEQTILLADRIRARIEASGFDGISDVTCSFGVATLKDGDNYQKLFDRADRAVYAAKKAGRNRVEAVLD